MPVSYADFVAEFPEFAQESEPLVSSKIAQAILETPASAWGEWTDKGVMLRTASALSLGPSGSTARVKGQQKTTYQLELERYERIAACGLGRTA
jgi:hypothetical protein